MEISIQLEDATIQQVVKDFVIPKFIPPFCHSHPLEEEASELFNNGTTTILQALYVLKHLRNSTKGTPILPPNLNCLVLNGPLNSTCFCLL
jgi:hypothetical protein